MYDTLHLAESSCDYGEIGKQNTQSAHRLRRLGRSVAWDGDDSLSWTGVGCCVYRTLHLGA